MAVGTGDASAAVGREPGSRVLILMAPRADRGALGGRLVSKAHDAGRLSVYGTRVARCVDMTAGTAYGFACCILKMRKTFGHHIGVAGTAGVRRHLCRYKPAGQHRCNSHYRQLHSHGARLTQSPRPNHRENHVWNITDVFVMIVAQCYSI